MKHKIVFRKGLSIPGSLKKFFVSQPIPPLAVQLSSSFFCGLSYSAKDKKIRHQVVLPVPAGLIEPHFDRPNLKDAAPLAEIIAAGLKKLHYNGEVIACLVPESCFKIFVFSLEALPPLEREKEKLLRFRVKKQMPVLPEDIRLSYEAMKLNGSTRALVSLARNAVLKEYEDILSGRGVKVGMLTAPTLSLLNVIRWEEEKNCLVVNVEEESMSLVAVGAAAMALYRLKPFAPERTPSPGMGERVGEIIKEIENTARFIEDKEKLEIQSLWLRSSWGEQRLLPELQKRLPFPVRPVEAPLLQAAEPGERALLTPLVGQIQ